MALAFLIVALIGLLIGGEAKPAEAPVALAPRAGDWKFKEGTRDRGPRLGFLDRTFPNLSLEMVGFECPEGIDLAVELVGLVPAQRFPQPQVTVTLAGFSRSAIPTARYHPATRPERLPASFRLENAVAGAPEWPGHPAYATLLFRLRTERAALGALASGHPLRFAFDGQVQDFPPVPAALARRFGEACAARAAPLSGPLR